MLELLRAILLRLSYDHAGAVLLQAGDLRESLNGTASDAPLARTLFFSRIHAN